jgi:hypothetical protein
MQEEALAIRLEKARISKMALVKVSADLDAAQEKTEAQIKSTSTRCKRTPCMPNMPLASIRC